MITDYNIQYFPAYLAFTVRALSSLLGSNFPEGWLCANIILDADAFKAIEKIIRISTITASLPPTDISAIPSTH